MEASSTTLHLRCGSTEELREKPSRPAASSRYPGSVMRSGISERVAVRSPVVANPYRATPPSKNSEKATLMATQGQVCDGRRSQIEMMRAAMVGTAMARNATDCHGPSRPVAAATATDPPTKR